MTASTQDARPALVLRAFFVSGLLLGMPGGLLPVWGYHLHTEFSTAANFFLALGAGMGFGAFLAHRLGAKIPLERLLAISLFVAALALLMLSMATPPAQVWYQAVSLFVSGAAAGAINTVVFEAIAPAWESDPAGLTLRGGVWFGCGSIAGAWLLSLCLGDANAIRLLAVSALLPAVVPFLLRRQKFSLQKVTTLPLEEGARDLRSVLALIFACLLFFQFANEWAIAGWLPVFLIDQLGMNPASAVGLLAWYWVSLTAGRAGATYLLTRVSHSQLLGASAFCALFGCTALALSGTRGGAVVGVMLTGFGFSSIYPLAAERIATRYSYYHPGYFNGIFTFAMSGGILAPFILGHLAAIYGLRLIPLVVMLSSIAVFALVLVIRLGRKVSGN